MSEIAEIVPETKVNIVNPPNFLGLKTKLAPGSLDEILARADRMVAALQGEFEAGAELRFTKPGEITRLYWPAIATPDGPARPSRRPSPRIKGDAASSR